MKTELEKQSAASLRNINDKFSSKLDTIEDQLKQDTVGLVQLDDFRRKREALEKEQRQKRMREEQALLAFEESRRKAKMAKTKSGAGLSFRFEEDEQEQEEEGEQDRQDSLPRAQPDGDQPTESPQEKKKMLKNPFVDTSFLPDRERELEEARLREELEQQWQAEQEKIKNEKIQITYSFYDGVGHRRQLTVKKGATIAQFLDLVRREFWELRSVNVDSLMYIKEDLIIPHVGGSFSFSFSLFFCFCFFIYLFICLGCACSIFHFTI
eukprot:TRINITY_DN397_c0_g1_i3.p1 TRINITY_DN397_c0_g1~~TRINITY_DN397_c0_g1_i3.p1  ORF type:complete len:298 (+),score=91.61 TRINITY_DN397_c0_g1_i3:95-895(+)